MKLTAHGISNQDENRLGGQDFVELREDRLGQPTVLKAYASPDGKILRFVLPELFNFAQVKINPDLHYIEFDRDALAAKRSINK